MVNKLKSSLFTIVVVLISMTVTAQTKPTFDKRVQNKKIVVDFIGSVLTIAKLVNCSVLFASKGRLKNESEDNADGGQFQDTNSEILNLVSSKSGREIILVDFFQEFSVKRDSSINRRGENCFVNIISLPDTTAETINKFSNLITWRYGAVTWKDTDYYIFCIMGESRNRINSESSGSKIDSFLIENTMLKIKYKIVVGLETLHNSKKKEEEKKLEFVVKSVCFYCNSGNPRIIQFSDVIKTWLSSRQLPHIYHLFPDFVQNFHGFKIRAAVSSKIVYRIEIYRKTDGSWAGKPGVHTRMIELCRKQLNFTYELFPSIGGGGSGVKWPNGTWTGSMADILYNNADFGMVTAQTLQRDELVSFSFPITYDWLTFATGLPRTIHTWKAVFWPFSLTFWILIAFAVLFTIVALYVIAIFSPREKVNLRIDQTLLYIFGSLMDQYFINPKTLALKFLCGFWTIFVLNVATAYRSELVSCLAFPFVEQPPQTFEQLTQSSYKWGLYYLAGAAYSAFRSSTNPTYVKIFHGMELEHSSVNCLVRAIESKFACIIYEGSAVDVGYRNLSDRYGRFPIVVSPTTTFFISSCWVMEKRAIFRQNFEKIMHFAVDMGLSKRWVEMNYQRIKDERPKEAKNIQYDFSKDEGPVPLTYDNFIGPYFILVFGLFSGIVAYIFERSWKFLRKKILRRTAKDRLIEKTTDGIAKYFPRMIKSRQTNINIPSSSRSILQNQQNEDNTNKYWNVINREITSGI